MMKVSMSPKVTKRKRRLFTPEFKAEAVRLVRGSGKTVAKVARELDLTATCLRAWVNQAEADEKGDGQGALTTDERAELTRLRRELRTVEQRVGRKRVARLTRQDGLRARHRRRFVNTTQSRHKFPIARNVIAREFEVSAPNQVWVSDLTYLRTQTGFVYMAVVLDL